MFRRLRKLTRGVRAEDGMTLIELSVAASLLLVVLVGLLTFLDDTQTNLNRQISRSTSNDQVRLAVESIDRDVRSGNVLYDPATENYNVGCSTAEFPTCGDIKPGMSLRIYTETNDPTRGGATCVQWRITAGGELQRRSWLPGATSANTWRIVATNIMNRTNSVSAFSRSGSLANLINVDLLANQDATGAQGSTVEVKESISGRNTLQYSNTEPCGPMTPDPTITTAGAGVSLFYAIPNY